MTVIDDELMSDSENNPTDIIESDKSNVRRRRQQSLMLINVNDMPILD